MAVNNPAGDYFNPPSNLSQDFEEYRFEDLEVDELFWQTNKPKEEQIPWRKSSLTEGMNLKTQKIYTFDRKTKVFQKYNECKSSFKHSRRRKVITKNMILEAQKHTKSNMAAAKWMGVCYTTYRKWAKYYKVFDQHLNQTGIGIQKGWVSRTTNVEDIILGKRKVPRKWNQSTVKEELIKKGYWLEECHNCGYNETNLATGKVCLGIDFKDGDSKNWLDGNIRLLCANCYYSFNGYFPSAKKFCK